MQKKQPSMLRSIIQILVLTVAFNILNSIKLYFPEQEVFEIISRYLPIPYTIGIILWGITASFRVIQKEAKRYLLGIAGLSVFWIVVRTLKFSAHLSDEINIYLWYSYYVGILLIPLFLLFIAISLGKHENYRLPKKVTVFFLPTLILLLLVLTNNLHELVFRFKGRPNSDVGTYTHAVLYFVLLFWVFNLILGALGILIHKCRRRRDTWKKYLPLLPIGITAMYTVLYILWNLNVISFRFLTRDMISFYCFTTILTLECLIRCGLIPANTHYMHLFSLADIDAVITDKDNRILAQATNADIDVTQILNAEADSLLTADKKRVTRHTISGGHVIWQEDISALLEAKDKLLDLDEQLKGRIITLQEEYDSEKKKKRLVEQNRIYNLMQNQTAPQIHKALSLLSALEQTADKSEELQLLARISVICAYIKRRNNLIFLSEDQSKLPSTELDYCIRETVKELSVYGTSCNYHMSCDAMLPFYSIMKLYDMLEAVLEAAFDGLRAVFISVRQEPELTLSIRIDTDAAFHMPDVEGLTVLHEDEGYVITYREGGAA